MPRDVIAAEVELIRTLGVEFRCNVEVGRDISFDEIRKDFDAVVISVGLKRSRRLPLPGVDAEGVYGAVEFLREIALKRKVPLG